MTESEETMVEHLRAVLHDRSASGYRGKNRYRVTVWSPDDRKIDERLFTSRALAAQFARRTSISRIDAALSETQEG